MPAYRQAGKILKFFICHFDFYILHFKLDHELSKTS